VLFYGFCIGKPCFKIEKRLDKSFACGIYPDKLLVGCTVPAGCISCGVHIPFYAVGKSASRERPGVYVAFELVALGVGKSRKSAFCIGYNVTAGVFSQNRGVGGVNELYKLITGDSDKEIMIYMTRRHIIFHIDNVIFFSRLVDGEYIDYDRIIIRQHKIHATVNRDVLLAALDRAALITEERVAGNVRSHVKLQFESGMLKVLASSAAGSTYDEIEIEHEGADLLIAFNNRYLIDSVRACEAENIRIALSSPLTSVNIEPADEEDSTSEDLFMLLPVRMKE